MELHLSESDRAVLAGERGEAARTAMRLIVDMAAVVGADRLIDVTCAHIDGGLYHGLAGLDWARKLRDGGGRVVVPTTMNVSSLDLIHPSLYKGPPEEARAARTLMDCYIAMGCEPTWTCAPYQLPRRPAFGEQIAWAESNAIVFANSVLGARTERYGDFIDISAALTGRVPDAGLHRDEGRAGQVLIALDGVPSHLLDEDVFYPVLGHLVGGLASTQVPVIDGLPSGVSEDRLKGLGAAAASSGVVALFHAVGVTPEARTLDDAFRGREPERIVTITPDELAHARAELTTATGNRIDAVSLGTPHYSLAEFEKLVALLDGASPAVGVYVSTGRAVLAEIERRGWLEVLERAGVQVVVDTCTYITPILRGTGSAGPQNKSGTGSAVPQNKTGTGSAGPQNKSGTGSSAAGDGSIQTVMTDSAKWAYYAPGNIGVDVVFGSTEECVRSAATGRVWRDERLWGG